MAPLTGRPAALASQRADFLVELCGRNALHSFDRVIASELALAHTRDFKAHDPTSTNADWFPELVDFISPFQWTELATGIDDQVRQRGLNREQRRKLKRQMFKSSRPSSDMRRFLNGQAETGDYSEILNLYPMRPADAQVLTQYFAGAATKEQAERAFLESLRDPRWMMKWFFAHSDKLTPVTAWLREPAKAMLASMREVANAAKSLRNLALALGPTYQSEHLTPHGWKRAQDALLQNVATRARQPSETHFSELSISDIDQFCPGLSTMVRSLHSSLWDAVAAKPREPLESDFVDAVHAIYVPYVDVFRADRYMAPHIRREAKKRETLVVSRLVELPDAIHSQLQSRAQSG